MTETTILLFFVFASLVCYLQEKRPPSAPSPIPFKKRFRAQNKSSMRSDGAGAGTPSLRGVECRVGEARVLGFVSPCSVGKKLEQRLELLHCFALHRRRLCRATQCKHFLCEALRKIKPPQAVLFLKQCPAKLYAKQDSVKILLCISYIFFRAHKM